MSKAGRTTALLAGLVAAAGTVFCARQGLPSALEIQRLTLFAVAGMVIWPCASVPWTLLLPWKWRKWAIWLLTAGGFWAQGMPLLIGIHGSYIPNPRAIACVMVAALAGSTLIGLTTHERWGRRLPLVAPILAILVLAMAAAPGEKTLWVIRSSGVKVRDLTIIASATVEDFNDPGGTLRGVFWDGKTVIFGHDKVLIRMGDGRIKIGEMPVEPHDIEAHLTKIRMYIADRNAGRVHCFDQDGEVAWEVSDLGPVQSVVWSSEAGWFLEYPGQDGTQSVLHRIALSDGRRTDFIVRPPQGMIWVIPTNSPPTYLVVDGETPIVRGFAVQDSAKKDKSAPYLIAPIGESAKIPMVALTEIDGEPLGAAGNILVFTRREPLKLIARDLASQRGLWSLSVSGVVSMGEVFVGPTQVVIACEVTEGNAGRIQTTLAAYDLFTAEELWVRRMDTRPAWLAMIDEDMLLLGQDGALSRVGPDGRNDWTTKCTGPARVLWLDEAAGQITLLETEKNPMVAEAGTEVTFSLADGSVLDRPIDQPGRFVYTVEDRVVFRSSGYDAGKVPLEKLTGRGVLIGGLVRGTGGVLAGPELVVTASEDGGALTLHFLSRPKASQRR